MRQFVALLIVSIIYVTVASVEFTYGCSDIPILVGEQNYMNTCPFGDAIVVSKEEKLFLGKPVGVSTDCVNLKDGLWETRDWDRAYNRWIIKRYNPSEFEIYTMDGRLIPTVRGDVLIERIPVEE